MEYKYEAREADPVMLLLADDLANANGEVKRLKDGIREVINTVDEGSEIFEKLSKLVNS